MWFGNSIRQRLLAAMAILAVGPMVLLGVVLVASDYRAEIEQVQAFQRELTLRTLDSVRFYVHEQEAALTSLARMHDLMLMPPRETHALLTSYMHTMKHEHDGDVYEELSLLDTSGMELVRVSRLRVLSHEDLRDFTGRPEFTEPVETGEAYFSPVWFSEQTGEPLIKISIPITDSQTGRSRGVLMAGVKLKFTWGVLSEVPLCDTCTAYVVDGSGRIIAHRNPSLVLRETLVNLPKQSGTSITTGILGEKAMVSTEDVHFGAQTFRVVLEEPLMDALAHPIRSFTTVLIFIALAVTGTVALGYVLINRIVKPIEYLADTAKAITGGDLSRKATVGGGAELETLGNAFNGMTEQLVGTIQSLKDEKDKLRAYLDTAAIMVVILDSVGRVKLINRKGLEIIGCDEDEVVGRDWFDNFIEPTCRDAHRGVHLSLQSDGSTRARYHECTVMSRSTQPRMIAWYTTALRDASGSVIATLGSGLDITESKGAERRIIEQNEFITSTLESLSHPFYVINTADYTVMAANSACGFGALTPESKCHKLTHHSDYPCSGVDHPCTIREVMRTRKPVTLEHVHYDHDMNTSYFEVHGYPIFDESGAITQVIEYDIDVTERRQLQEQLLQAQKMESVGRLAGGVAHDFNNLLSAIIGYGELVLNDLPENSPVRGSIQIMADAGEKAAVLTRQLLAFSRKQILQVKVTSLNEVIEGLMKILTRIIGEDITLEVNLGSQAHIKADPAQLEQVLLNLAINARDAMPGGGHITIETSDIEIDEAYAAAHRDVSRGRYSMLAVTDNGEGMTREVQQKIFEPFFTTKGQAGTGLGLATVYGIVKQHGGHIFVYSEPGTGTTFKVYLQATHETATDAGAQKAAPLETRGTETILVVDDETSIRQLIADSLEPLGYRVLDAETSAKALEICRAAEGEIHLLLTDVIMPDMYGDALARAVMEIRPSARVLFMSGYTDEVIARRGILDAGSNFIQKPLSPSKLVRKIREIIDTAT